jgi:solute carrier family 25 (mitochondrial oxoglutarate transporter), member 11
MRQAVYGTARLGLHREFSDRLKASQGGGDLPAWKSAGSAMCAGALASVIGTPFDVSLVRMQADGMKPVAERRGYRNVFDALGRIAREEGVGKLWRGFEPTAFRAVAMNVGMMASYDQAKQAIAKVRAGGRGRTGRAGRRLGFPARA